MGSTKSPFSHITVDSLAPEDASQTPMPSKEDDEIIEVGYPSISSKTVYPHLESAPSVEDVMGADTGLAASDESPQGVVAPKSAVSKEPMPDDDLPDYSVDDLDAMPLTQKIVIIALIICLIIAGLYVLDYYGLVHIDFLSNLSKLTSL